MRKQKIEYLELWEDLKKAKKTSKKAEIKKKLAEIYYPLVKSIAKKMEKKLSNISVEELASYGVDGLYFD